ncbi:MAG: alpha/beta hydrolase [Bacteroidetes bacterium]|nr:alpha/beta hydrolase [Bacteroidota bacterium]MBS1649471.1 alpha/beta hydrolase [Bacteroidota bacterium]
MRWFKKIVAIISILLIIYLLGPKPSTPVYNINLPSIPENSAALLNYIQTNESAHKIKPDNEARIIWNNDSLKEKTEYAIVYLHGFSASQEEGNPVHKNIAKQFGCNLYLYRLSQHGIDTTDELQNLTADNYWESAKTAYTIGKQLGDKVILMGTSTGASLALQLAATYPDIAGLILISPNIEINDPNAWVLNNHWGLQIARMVLKSKYRDITNKPNDYKKYWNTHYRLESAVALEELLETTMNKTTFAKVTQPTLTLYYYKDAQHQDNVVKVGAIEKMFNELATPANEKRLIAVPNAENHVLCSPIQSKDIITPQKEIAAFLKEVIKLPVQ